MKRYFAVFAVLCLSIMMTVGCTPSSSNDSTTPTTTSTTTESNTTTTTFVEGVGGGSEWDFSRSYHLNFSVDSFVEELVGKDRFASWCAQFEHAGEGGTRNRLECNYYELIQDFSIPREDMEELCAGYDGDIITPQEIALLYTGSRLEVYEHFANPHAVMAGIYAYSPKWLTEHTAEDYREVGITYDLLTAKLDDVLEPCTAEQQAYIRTQCEALKD